MSLCSRNFPAQEIRFLSFLAPEASAPDSHSSETRSYRFLLSKAVWLRSLLHQIRDLKRDWRDHCVSAESVDACAARLFTILLLIAVVLSANLIVVHAQPQAGSAQRQTVSVRAQLASAQPRSVSAERVLFDAANRERAAQGLMLLRWDDALANAARDHALLMAQRNSLSHQFAGEAALQDRARVAGARFTEIAENVAQGPAADVIHSSWMHSPPHRANLLDPGLTAIGIAVVGTASHDGAGSAGNGAGSRPNDYGGRDSGMLFAVEDFSQSVANLSLGEQERLVGAALAVRGLQVVNFNGGASNAGESMVRGSNANTGFTNASVVSAPPSSMRGASGATESIATNSNAASTMASGRGIAADARKTCEMERGWAGSRPGLVVRYETGDLSRLPGDLEQKIQTGRYQVAAVGACEAGSSRGFTRFRVAVLLY
jgi:uncharacterized protein YkwD